MTVIKLDTYRNIKWLAEQQESPERVAEVIEEIVDGLEDKDRAIVAGLLNDRLFGECFKEGELE